MAKKIVFINSHPIQYFAPLYQYLQHQGLAIEVWYCSDENISGHVDRQFGRYVRWDIPLLEGYSSRFFVNRSIRPSIYSGFLGLFNPGLLIALLRYPKSIMVVHGWGYSTHVLAILLGRIRGHKICLRSETPLNQEKMKRPALRLIKRILLGGILFRFVDQFLFIGTQNRLFYESYGISASRLKSVPYAVDNHRFREEANRLRDSKAVLRKNLGLPVEARIFLFVAKFIEKKRPLDVLRAFKELNDEGTVLILVGDGKLRPELERFVMEGKLTNVFLPGFVNQTELGTYYTVADVFVLPSGLDETWGLVVNEAMNFDLALIVADHVGCASDLVIEGGNGFIYPTGDVQQLVFCMRHSATLKGTVGRPKLKDYSFERINESLAELLN